MDFYDLKVEKEILAALFRLIAKDPDIKDKITTAMIESETANPKVNKWHCARILTKKYGLKIRKARIEKKQGHFLVWDELKIMIELKENLEVLSRTYSEILAKM